MTIYSFHAGQPLNIWERCCLQSFADHGHETVLFSYDRLDVPEVVRLADAREVLPVSEYHAFFAKWPGRFGQFSDLFRYDLLFERGGWWIDTDMLCLSPHLPFKSEDEVIIGLKEPVNVKRLGTFRIANGLMRFPVGHPLLAEASAFVRENLDLVGTSGRSIMGPDLMTRLIQKHGIEPQDIKLFYSISGPDAWDLLDPEKRDDVAVAVSQSPMVHLWQERFRSAGFPRDKLPPAGSFLAEAFARHGGATGDRLSREAVVAFAARVSQAERDAKKKAKGKMPKEPKRSGLRSKLSGLFAR